MSNDLEFKSIKLYDQKCFIDDSKIVASRVYATSYVYPGSISAVTARCRTTIVYEETSSNFIAAGGTIEKWSDKGWQVIEELFDTCVEINSLEQGLDYMLAIYKSFTLGLPITYSGKIEDDPPPSPDNNPDKSPNLRVLSFKDKAKSYENKKSKPTESSADPDSPDFDWI